MVIADGSTPSNAPRSQTEVPAMTNLLMNRTRSRLLHFLSKNGPSTSAQIAAGIGLSPSTVRKHLSVLVSSGCVEVSRNAVCTRHGSSLLRQRWEDPGTK